MTVFAILLPNEQPRLVEQIQSRFPSDHIQVTPTQWLVSSNGTAIDVTKDLGMFDRANPGADPTGFAIVIGFSSYFGRAPSHVWDWVKTKMEGRS